MIGELLKIDYNTDEEQRCKFARMAVVLNLEKPLVPRVWLNGKSKKVEYEGVPRVCSHCGVYGHVKEVCPKYDPEVENIPKTGEVYNADNQAEKKTEESPFGPWMLVTRRNTRRFSNRQHVPRSGWGASSKVQGSRIWGL